MRRVIKIDHFTRFPEYFTDRDHFLQSQKVTNAREKCSDLAGTSHTTTKGNITYVGFITCCGLLFWISYRLFLKVQKPLYNLWMPLFILDLIILVSRIDISCFQKKIGKCVHERTVPWFLYTLLTLCSAAVEHRPFPSINTPFPPLL